MWNVQLKDVMTPNVEVAHPDNTIQEAAAKMDRLDVGPLPVCDGKRVVGMITDRDITVRATAVGRGPQETRVGDVMSRDIVFCYEDQDVGDAARLMQEKQIRRLVVLDRNEELAGIVSLGDIAVYGGSDQLSGTTLEAVSEPGRPDREPNSGSQ
jgi:CBS domain-containing protein